jgi:ubiquitin C-terminal hydrolase
MAIAYAQLLHDVADADGRPVSPGNFHKALCKHGSQFRGYDEQDSHEFLQFLLNGLHEDLNLVRKKPYI